MTIKIFLIASVIAASFWLLRGERRGGRLALTRLAGLAFAGSWIVGVLSPDAVTWVANLVGVGRGTDLVLYVLVVGFMFTTVVLQQRLRSVEERIAQLTRAQALLERDAETGQTLLPRIHD